MPKSPNPFFATGGTIGELEDQLQKMDPSALPFVGAYLYRTSAQATTGASATPTWQAALYDTNAFWSSTVNPSRLTIPLQGFYLVNAVVVKKEQGAASSLSLYVNKNGSQGGIRYGPEGVQVAAGTFRSVQATAIVRLNVGDYIDLLVGDSVANQDIQGGATLSSLQAHFLGTSPST